MGKQVSVEGHPVFELGGDLFTLAFPRDYGLAAYLHWRLRELPDPLDLYLWRRLREVKTWQGYVNIDPDLGKYENGLDYIKHTPSLSDLAGFVEEPSLMQRIVGNSNGLGCFLFSSEYVSPASEKKGNYGSRQKLLEVMSKTDMPVINEKGQLMWAFRPMLIPLNRETKVPDTLLFERSNPNGLMISGGTFTLNGHDVRQFKGPLNIQGLEALQLEETAEPDQMVRWFAWGGCLYSMDVLWHVIPNTILEYIGRP